MGRAGRGLQRPEHWTEMGSAQRACVGWVALTHSDLSCLGSGQGTQGLRPTMGLSPHRCGSEAWAAGVIC